MMAVADKRFASAQARAALLGAVLMRTEDDRGSDLFVLSRWSLTKAFSDLADVEAWMDRFRSGKR